MSPAAQHIVVCDTEVFPGYFLAAFKNVATGEVLTAELTPDHPLDTHLVVDILASDIVVTFNGNNFDIPILWAAIAGKDNATLQAIADDIILGNARPWQVERDYGFRCRPTNHIDLIEVAPLDASLKIYNGRLHGKRMQDLPYEPGQALTAEQQTLLKQYCVNDLAATELLLQALEEPLKLREQMSSEYGIDLRSKSDAQIAEAVIIKRLEQGGKRPERPSIPEWTSYKYRVPDFIKFETEQFRHMLDVVSGATYRVSPTGKVEIPASVTSLDLRMGSSTYNMGNGGLHSCEESAAHLSDERVTIKDFDVASYYPNIILNLGLYPQHLGESFLETYRKIVEERLDAKARVKEIKDELKGLRRQLETIDG